MTERGKKRGTDIYFKSTPPENDTRIQPEVALPNINPVSTGNGRTRYVRYSAARQ